MDEADPQPDNPAAPAEPDGTQSGTNDIADPSPPVETDFPPRETDLPVEQAPNPAPDSDDN